MSAQTDVKTRSGKVISAGLWIAGVGVGFALLLAILGGNAYLGVIAAVIGLVLAAVGWAWRITSLLESRQT